MHPVMGRFYGLKLSASSTNLNCRPSVYSFPLGLDMEFGLIQQTLPKPELIFSELEGLNLNITIPTGILEGTKLPVFVWIHGGGFFIGSSSWPQYDHAQFVALSQRKGSPVIGISIK
jgi:hypothetical protein